MFDVRLHNLDLRYFLDYSKKNLHGLLYDTLHDTLDRAAFSIVAAVFRHLSQRFKVKLSALFDSAVKLISKFTIFSFYAVHHEPHVILLDFV